MFRSKAVRLLLAVLVLVVGALAIGNIEIELPPALQGVHQIEGQIVACEFGNLTRHNDKFFLGVTLSAADAPVLRANPLIRERLNYEALCSRKPRVRVFYTAKQRLLGPTRFWIEKIEVIET
jgi:hypothetical protein